MDESLPCATPSSVSHPAPFRPNARTGLDSAMPVNEDRPDPTQVAGYCVIA
ncbi:pheromone precursor [Trametes sanguinea]|nr:pheromone precursor [Trametes sanguinea]